MFVFTKRVLCPTSRRALKPATPRYLFSIFLPLPTSPSVQLNGFTAHLWRIQKGRLFVYGRHAAVIPPAFPQATKQVAHYRSPVATSVQHSVSRFTEAQPGMPTATIPATTSVASSACRPVGQEQRRRRHTQLSSRSPFAHRNSIRPQGHRQPPVTQSGCLPRLGGRPVGWECLPRPRSSAPTSINRTSNRLHRNRRRRQQRNGRGTRAWPSWGW